MGMGGSRGPSQHRLRRLISPLGTLAPAWRYCLPPSAALRSDAVVLLNRTNRAQATAGGSDAALGLVVFSLLKTYFPPPPTPKGCLADSRYQDRRAEERQERITQTCGAISHLYPR